MGVKGGAASLSATTESGLDSRRLFCSSWLRRYHVLVLVAVGVFCLFLIAICPYVADWTVACPPGVVVLRLSEREKLFDRRFKHAASIEVKARPFNAEAKAKQAGLFDMNSVFCRARGVFVSSFSRWRAPLVLSLSGCDMNTIRSCK